MADPCNLGLSQRLPLQGFARCRAGRESGRVIVSHDPNFSRVAAFLPDTIAALPHVLVSDGAW